MQREPECPACRDTGWFHFTHFVKGRGLPWSAACLCDKGRFLSTERPHHVKSLPKPSDPNSLPPPVVVQPINREMYLDRLREIGGEDAPLPKLRTPDRGVWE